MKYKLIAYRKSEDIPPRPEKDIFHSATLFKVYEQTSGYHPVLIEVSDNGIPLARLLAVVRKSVRLFPPSIIKRCEVYGFGEYFLEQGTSGGNAEPGGYADTKDIVFDQMLTFLTRHLLKKCFLIEFRNLDNALFAYNSFRKNGYFPVNWLRIHNSLHSKPPYERLSGSRRRQIALALKSGVTVQTATTEEEVRALGRLLKRNYASKIRKHFPGLSFFPQLLKQERDKETGKIFVVKYKGRIIGGSVCLYSNENAYLLFSGGLRKSYPKQYPGVLAVWAALTYAYEQGYKHMEFMDVGLPFNRHGYRDFLLRFGGAQYSTRRWFRFRWSWLNKLLTYLYI